jgi:hypothetical protein
LGIGSVERMVEKSLRSRLDVGVTSVIDGNPLCVLASAIRRG